MTLVTISHVNANRIVYDPKSGVLSVHGGAVLRGAAPALTGKSEIINTSGFIGKNQTWITYSPNGSWIEQSATTYELEDGYKLLHLAGVSVENVSVSFSENNKVNTTGLLRGDYGDTWFWAFCKARFSDINVEVLSMVYNLVDNGNSFLADLTTTMTNLGWSIKQGSQKKDCGSSDVYVLTKDNGQWEVAWSTWTTGSNCDTTASYQTISYALRNAVNDEEYNRKMGFCVRMDHGGTWHADVRVQRAWNRPYTNIWNMPCTDLQQSYTLTDDCKSDYSGDF